MSSVRKDTLKKRLDENYTAFIESLQEKTVSELIAMAPEITAAQQLHEELLDACDEEDVEFIKQRDLYRLRVMEEYCKGTSCLRNYILKYFGEKVAMPCDNCGNCHHRYEEVDMTEDAKQVINCLAETRGRYGIAIVTGTLFGANRARLRETGADSFRTYGALAHRTEADVRPC